MTQYHTHSKFTSEVLCNNSCDRMGIYSDPLTLTPIRTVRLWPIRVKYVMAANNHTSARFSASSGGATSEDCLGTPNDDDVDGSGGLYRSRRLRSRIPAKPATDPSIYSSGVNNIMVVSGDRWSVAILGGGSNI
ncbi:hypothetical protein L1987_46884 [Smallanthus sonchifolius]|uniref:Uncharacterized protein n=1 Tax=Smallanthus sonchifolius TaxID=185202 RepID=A0ACB9G132_9ASTR|nr:hypothetical protein L1987_46884 [Smallanthus sonchifolius]